MSKTSKKWLASLLRWGIAVVGIWYVLSNLSWSNRVLVAGPGGWPVVRRLVAGQEAEKAASFQILDDHDSIHTVPRDELLAKVDAAHVIVRRNGEDRPYDLQARKVPAGISLDQQQQWDYIVSPRRNLWQRYWNIHAGQIETIHPAEIVSKYEPALNSPLIEPGIGPMLHRADGRLLLAAIFIFPVVFLITALRWHELLKALDIRMGYGQALVLNMVGSFWNTFMPGSTGGDVLKAYYASKLTTHRTRAVMSVVIDRIIGLIALVILGGVMATVGVFIMTPTDPARRKCAQIAIASLLIVLGTCTGLLVFYVPILSRRTGLNWILQRLPMQQQVRKAIETMEIYRTRPMLVLATVAMTLPVHAIVVTSAMLAGMAFGLKLHVLYYWVVVPVVVLVGSIPISLQGAGVMEFFAILLTKSQGLHVGEAVMLTMSIRVVQILWNLTGGLFVLHGGFHAPTETEKHSMEVDA